MEWVKITCNIFEHRKIKLIRRGPEVTPWCCSG